MMTALLVIAVLLNGAVGLWLHKRCMRLGSRCASLEASNKDTQQQLRSLLSHMQYLLQEDAARSRKMHLGD